MSNALVADRPWWLQWRGLPPSTERRIAEPERAYTRGEVWLMRLGVPVTLVLAVGLGLAFGLWGGIGSVIFVPVQWFRMTPHQRRQVLGRRTT